MTAMGVIPLRHGLLLAGILFGLGLCGLLVRRNLLFTLMSIEVMLNAAGLAFVVAGSRWGQADGQVMFIFILTMAAAEVSVGLALVLLVEMVYLLTATGSPPIVSRPVGPREVGLTLFGPYLLGVEAASLLLLAGLVGAFHLGRRREEGNG